METQMETDSGGVVIAESPDSAQKTMNAFDDDFELFVGDYIEFTQGPRVGTKGMIYYLDEELLRILPDGASDRVVDIPTDIFLDENTRIKRDPTSLNSFVEIADLKEGNAVQTFDPNGVPVAAYKIQSINVNEDSVILSEIDADGNESGDTIDVLFTEDGRVRGIPREMDFAVMRTQEAPKPVVEEEEREEEEEEEEEIVLDQVVYEENENVDEAEEYIRERRPEEVIYDDQEQKNDFIENERAALKPQQRTNPKKLQTIRRLMENCLQLRNDILEYKESGRVEEKTVTYQTLANLLKETRFPLAKQVLRVYKTLYLDHSPNYFADDAQEEDPYTIDDPTIDIEYLSEAVDGGIAFLEEQFKKGTPEMGTLQLSQRLPQMYTVFQTFYETYFRVMGALKSEDDSIESIEFDRDFFRINPLNTPDPSLKGISHIEGKNFPASAYDVTNIELSYMRALKPRVGKYGDRKTKITGVIEQGDEAEVWIYIMFPFLFLRDLGAIRSGKLILDVANGYTNPKTIKMILDEAGGIQMIPKTGNIIAVDPEGTTSGNIELDDWLKGQALYGNGIGDILPYLKSIGLENSEFTPTQFEILLKKIQFYQANLKKFLIESRKKSNEIIRNPQPVQNFSLLSEEDQKKFLDALIQEEKILLDKVGEFKLKYPSWEKNDVAIFAYLYTQYPDYVLASLSGLPSVAQERKRVVDDMFLHRLYEAIAYQKKLNEEGDPPVINECDHVKNLADIRKIENDDQRIQVMIRKFLPMFAGKTEDHWIECKVCKGHLLCEHEYLMILERTHPNEKDMIHKKILLNFSDGVFNGKFICGNCGQAIQDLEFDTSMEFDDEGRPMIGNEPLSEEMETSLAKEIDKLLEVKSDDVSTRAKLDVSTDQGVRVAVLNEIATKVGVYPSIDAFERMLRVVERMVNNRSYKNIEIYNRWVEQQKSQTTARLQFPTYDQYVNQDLIANCAAAVLIEIQSAIPDYTIRSIAENCGDATFEGYPLSGDDKQTGALQYISCAVANLVRNEKPWGDTFWMRLEATKKEGLQRRIQSIVKLVKAQTEKISLEAEIQTLLEKKREYLRREKGEQAITGRHMDDIPSDFLPRPIVLSEEQVRNAENPLVDDAASPSQRVFAWILEGYRFARLYGVYERGNPLSEASCCYSNLQKPMSFWLDNVKMPSLPPRVPPLGPRGSILNLRMKVREPELLLGEPEPTLMYRLFLRVCFPREGIINPRVGLQHEPGYDNKCPYCQFEFPVDPRLPPPQLSYSKDKKIQDIYTKEYQTETQELYQAELQALQKAGVIQGNTVEKETFENLLQATNNHYVIPPLTVKKVTTDIETLQGLLTVDPEPFMGFRTLIRRLIDELVNLPKDATDLDVRVVYGPLSEKMTSFKESLDTYFTTRIPAGARAATLREWNILWNSPPENLGESLRTFLLLPMQRAMNPTQYQPPSILNERRKAIYSTISKNDRATIMQYFAKHIDQVPDILKELAKYPDEDTSKLLREKIELCIEKLIVTIPLFIKVLRANVLPYGGIGLPYLQRAILGGILWEFINPQSLGGKLVLGNILSFCLRKAQERDENILKTPEEIKRIITARNEDEKMEIINELDGMTPEAKRAELAMKSLGLGRWARGASKGIFSYDEEQQAFEAAERKRRGIEDFYGLGQQTQGGEGEGSGYDTYAQDGDE